MENLIEKLKSVDKKVWIGVGIGAAVLIILIIALVIGLSKKPASGNGTESEGSFWSEIFGTEDTETEGGVEEVFGTEEGTEVATEMGTETEMTETESQTQTQGVGGTTVTQNPDVNGVKQQPVTTKQDGQEILGVGTAANPYYETPNLNSMTVTTVTIPAGQTLYYNIYRVGGMWLSIEDADAYVIESNGTRHNASGGKVGFTVESALSSDAVSFQIGNSGSSAKSFTIKFSNIKGTYQNPEKITSAGQYTKHLSAGNDVGYNYIYKVEKKAAIRFYIISESTTCSISATNNRNSAQRTFQAEVQEDSKGRYVELEADFVEVGDEIRIVVCAEKYRGSIPAADVTWEIVYVE